MPVVSPELLLRSSNILKVPAEALGVLRVMKVAGQCGGEGGWGAALVGGAGP